MLIFFQQVLKMVVTEELYSTSVMFLVIETFSSFFF